jgi:hypothetical protein
VSLSLSEMKFEIKRLIFKSTSEKRFLLLPRCSTREGNPTMFKQCVPQRLSRYFIFHARATTSTSVLRSVVRWQEYWRLREGQSCLSITDSTILYCTILYCTVPPGRLYVCFHVCNSSVIMCATILLDGDTIVKNS